MSRTKRRTENQKLFREVNERIAELWTILDEGDAPLSVVCECWRVGCIERGLIPLDVYSRARQEGDLYIVVCGHEDLIHEETVEDHGEFMIVKLGEESPADQALPEAEPAETGAASGYVI